MNNFRKPIGTGTSSSRQVGGTYGERKQQQNNNIQSAGPQFYRPRDIFETKQPAGKTVSFFPANAQVMRTKSVQPHKVIETGRAHGRPTVTDPMRLNYLDRVIAVYGENKAPKTAIAKSAVKSTK